MFSITKLFESSFAGVCGLAVVCAASAAESPRAAALYGANRSVQVAHMSTMSVAPVSATGTVAVDKTVIADQQEQEQTQPQSTCPDGSVQNSEYGVAECMNDILSCVNNGALAGGLNDLFNEDMRNAIVNGMGLCSVQVDKCVTSVRRDCKNVYASYADVWVDFNSRKVQPEYYNFVLRKTGLTPNQAENTCLLLDRNTYGSSFAAVANDGTTTNEYNQQIGAYNNQQGNVLIKTNPMGVEVNEGHDGVDGQRGHYARWDATTATCYLRVAAYNKDEQIKNSWLFGALGDDRLAEVWRAAGETFSCNKDLFGFSLLNKTDTAAIVGVGGGALLGAGIGAISGGGKKVTNDFECGDKDSLAKLNKHLKNNPDVDKSLSTSLNKNPGDPVTAEQCDIIVSYYEQGGDSLCRKGYACYVEKDPLNVNGICENAVDSLDCESKVIASNPDYTPNSVKCITILDDKSDVCKSFTSALNSLDYLFEETSESNGGGRGGRALAGAAIGAGAGGVATAITAFVERSNITCHVGDGLSTVPFGKSHSIDTLKDFYVKWNLRLPDTVSPASTVVDCDSWRSACAQYTDMTQCKNVALNYRPATNSTTTIVQSACLPAGSVCIENGAVAKSHGACAQ